MGSKWIATFAALSFAAGAGWAQAPRPVDTELPETSDATPAALLAPGEAPAPECRRDGAVRSARPGRLDSLGGPGARRGPARRVSYGGACIRR